VQQRWLPSATVLVAGNLVPFAGVLFLGWDVFAVVFLPWLEDVVVGLFNVLRLLWIEQVRNRCRRRRSR
jgi:hypothetical protein